MLKALLKHEGGIHLTVFAGRGGTAYHSTLNEMLGLSNRGFLEKPPLLHEF